MEDSTLVKYISGLIIDAREAYNLTIKELFSIDKSFKKTDCDTLSDDEWRIFKNIIKKLDL